MRALGITPLLLKNSWPMSSRSGPGSRWRPLAAWLGLLLVAGQLSGCSSDPDPVVARVTGETIAASRLRAFVQSLPQGLRSPERGDAARHQYLQSLIDRHLVLAEAHGLGLDTTRALEQAVRQAVDSRVIALYRSRHLTPRAAVPEEEVRRAFAEEGYHRERQLSAILVHTRAQIDAVLAQLKAGRPFAEVARAHSLDERSAAQGGELGFIGLDAAPRLHVPPEVFRDLPQGEVSRPLRAGKSWHVVRFTQERPASYERYRPLIEERLFAERLAQVEAEHFEQLRESFHATLHPEGFDQLARAAQERRADSLATSRLVLYVYDGGQVTVAAAWEALQRRRAHRSLTDSTRAMIALERLVFRPVLLRQAALREGLYAVPEIESLARRTREDALLEAVRARLAPAEAPAEAEIRQYYDNYPERFYHEASTRVEELLLPTQAEALQAREELAAGASFADLAGHSRREDAVRLQARFHFHQRDQAAYPLLVQAVLQAEPGQLTGPLQVEGGYSVFRVLGRDPAGVEPYETAQRRARALLRRERQNQALDELVKNLRQKYADQLEVHPEHLAQALPDSLVGGS